MTDRGRWAFGTASRAADLPLRRRCQRQLWRSRTRFAMGLSLGIYASASPAMAQDAPPADPPPADAPAAPAPAEPRLDDQSEIVVIASPSEQTSIDRTTYIVRDNAESRVATALEILSRIPSVDVAPSGQVRLFGRSGVKILIDGREVSSPLDTLRNLQGSQIVRIEVISNPSAQFSAQGTAGVINVITRRTHGAGLGGSVTGSTGTFGSYDVKASPTWGSGRLSLSAVLGVSRNENRAEVRQERFSIGPASALEAVSSEVGTSRSESVNLRANILPTYRLSDRDTISSSVGVSLFDVHDSGRSNILTFAAPGSVLEQTSESDVRFDSRDYSLEYQRQGKRKGETLTIAAQRSTSDISSESAFLTSAAAGGQTQLALSDEHSSSISSLKMDLVRPAGEHRLLKLGGLVQRQSATSLAVEEGALLGGRPVERSSVFESTVTEKAGYLTYQFRFLGVTLLPGLRVESRRYDLSEVAAGDIGLGTYFFPTLHMERAFGSAVELDLSYSRRIAWPNTSSLNPATRFTDESTANVGNPRLRPEITNAYEAKVSARLGKHSVNLTAFSRRTRDLFSTLGELSPDGVFISRSINLGVLESLGVDIAVRGPLGSRFRYSASANLADESISDDTVQGSLLKTSPQYSLGGRLEYKDGAQDRKGADNANLSLRHSGPIDRGLFIASASTTLSATWSHALSDRLSSVLNVGGITIPRTRRLTYFSPAALATQFYRPLGLKVTASLTYSLRPPQRP